MATRKRSSSSGGFSSEPDTVEEKVAEEVTDPSTPEKLEEEIKTIEEFIEVSATALLEEVEKEEKVEPVRVPDPVHQNPLPNKPNVSRHRRNIPRFVRR